MAPPKDRKRKFHRRSKNGCQTCKRRHVRCDERHPLCTSCLQTGSECIYSHIHDVQETPAPAPGKGHPESEVLYPKEIMNLNSSLNDYVGGSFDALPEASKRLLRHFSQYAVWGQRPVVRELESSVIHKAFENPGYMHMCLMLSACQWAWAKGSMDTVRIPFMFHKTATYRFAREQLLRPETAQSGDTMLAISALALTEGAIGDLDTSSKHLKGFRTAMQSRTSKSSLTQRILKLAGESLRTNKSATLVNVPEYQPTFMALLFASIWDISALPPTEAPRYGWWEETDTQAARLWQNHTQDLNLNYEISRGFDPNTYKPRILNGDPRSSRTSFIATFFYIFSEVGDGQMDVVLIEWLLEQLIDDVSASEESMTASAWSGPLWLWCVMFGAAVAGSGKAANAIEDKQLSKWREVYSGKIKTVSQALGLDDWDSAKSILTGFIRNIDCETDEGLRGIWEASGSFTDELESRTTKSQS